MRKRGEKKNAQELSNLFANEKCEIENLSLANCSLKLDIIDFLDTLGSNASLVKLDISGNQIADKGAFALSKGIFDLQKYK